MHRVLPQKERKATNCCPVEKDQEGPTMVLAATGAGDVESCSLAGKAGGGQGCLVEEAALELSHYGLQSWPLGAQGSLGTGREQSFGGRVAPKHRVCKERKEKSEPQKHLLRGVPGVWFVTPAGPQRVVGSLFPWAQLKAHPFLSYAESQILK